jgi:hypothetical protein
MGDNLADERFDLGADGGPVCKLLRHDRVFGECPAAGESAPRQDDPSAIGGD